jgi:PPK2 family polyphosphate:nucleotide phosphotransferase
MAAMKLDPEDYRVRPGAKVSLRKIDSADDGGMDKEKALAELARLHERLIELQELLYADARHALLVVFQAMDGGGKDGTIGHVLKGINPQGTRVASFKAPNTVERAHDFLWRIHQNVPRKGYLGVFNRSHYEDVLIVRVKNLAPPEVWQSRYAHINAFEQMLHDEGTHMVKFYLHVSKAYQKETLQERLNDPVKQWKLSPDDVRERAHWDDYQKAYEAALGRCSTEHAPWYIVPAEHHWFRNLLVTRVLVEALEGLALSYPKPTYDPKKIVIPD